MRQCLLGNRQAQYDLYTRYAQGMLNVAYRILGNEASAADAVQDAFVEVFTRMRSFRGESTIGAWMKRIVVNKSLNILRQEKKWHIDELTDTHDFPVEEEMYEQDGFPFLVQQVKEAILSLPAGYRIVLSLHLLEDFPHAEIGAMLGISESTSKSQYHRARKKLQTLLLNQISAS